MRHPDMEEEQLAEVYGGPLKHDVSIYQFLERGLLRNPNGVAIVSMQQAPGHLSELAGSRNGIEINKGTNNCLI